MGSQDTMESVRPAMVRSMLVRPADGLLKGILELVEEAKIGKKRSPLIAVERWLVNDLRSCLLVDQILRACLTERQLMLFEVPRALDLDHDRLSRLGGMVAEKLVCKVEWPIEKRHQSYWELGSRGALAMPTKTGTPYPMMVMEVTVLA